MTLARSSSSTTVLSQAGAAFALSALLVFAPAPASAGDGGAVAAGIVGGVALGALAAGAFQPAPVYVAPPPPRVRVYAEPEPIYVAPPPRRRVYVERACGWEVERVWTGYRWVHERVRVCD